MILNLACGQNKIPGCINVDKYTTCDLRADLFELPFSFGSVDTVYLFHAIEHFEEPKQVQILTKIWNILKPNGRFVISYPEFTKVAQNYINNYKGQRDFWKMTIYGRQLHEGDYHLSLMDTQFFVPLLKQIGFVDIQVSTEKEETYNTVVKCRKGQMPPTLDDVYRKIIWNI